jgi:hypothetical protein
LVAENYKITRHGDRKLVNVFCEALRNGYVDEVTFNFISQITQVKLTEPDNLPELLRFVSEKNACVIKSISIRKSGLGVSVHRTDSPLYDELRIDWNAQNQKHPLPDRDRAELISWFTEIFLEYDPERGLFTSTDIAEAAQNELALRSATIERFEQVQAKLAEDTAAFNKTIQDNYLTEKDKLDARFEEERARLSEEFAQKDIALKKRAADLDKREANIDASDNTAARRQIRKDLLEELQRRSEKFALTSGTKSLRWPVHAVSLSIIIGGLIGAYFFGSKIPVIEGSISATHILTFIKSFSLSFVSIGTAFFYLRWLNRWFEQHAQAEFKLKQFQLDIERASWLVETALDWDSKQDNELPRELLEGLSRNLFSFEEEKIDQVRHPVDELASALMGSASRVKLNLAGNEVELDGKRLSKSVKKAT